MRYINTLNSIIEKQKGISILQMTDDAFLFGGALLQIRKNYCLLEARALSNHACQAFP